MDLSPQQHDALISAEQRTRAEIRRRIVTYATTVWNGLGSWRDSDIQRFVNLIAPKVLAGQQNIADLTDAYLSASTGLDRVGRIDLSQGLRNGVPTDDVYQRPAVEMRTALSQGSMFTDALEAGAVRLASLVSMDLQLANTHQARKFGTSHDVPAWARTLTGSENCALCVIASTQRYHTGVLMPIHPGCDCGVKDLGAGRLPQVIDRALLEATHDQVAEFAGIADRGGRAVDYRKLIVTHEHGEYGPTLAWKGQQFTGPSALAA